MNINRAVIISFFFLLTTLIFICCNCKNNNDKQNHSVGDYSLNITDKTLIDYYVTMSSKVQENYLNNKQLINELIHKKESLLVYRYSIYMCNGCIMEDLATLFDYQTIVGKDKILVLPYFENSRENKILVMNELSRFNYKYIPDSILTIPLTSELIHHRYFAYIDEKKNMSMIFFPIRGKSELTQMYFSEIDKMMRE